MTAAEDRVGDAIIEPLEPPSDVHLADTSDAMIDQLAGFRNAMTGPLGELYRRWAGHPCRGQDWNAIQLPYGEGDQERNLLRQLRGFGFGHLWGAGGRAGNLGAAAEAAKRVDAQVKQALGAAWSGTAAEVAREKLDQFDRALEEYAGYVTGLGEALRRLWSTIRPPLVDLAKVPEGGSAKEFLSRHDPDDCPGQNMFIDRLTDAMNWGRHGVGSSRVADNQGVGTGPIAPRDLRGTPGLVDLDTGYDSKWADMFCREMDAFAQGYANAMGQYRGAIEAAYRAAQEGLRAFADVLNVPTDPFGSLRLGAEGAADHAPTVQPPPGGTGSGTPSPAGPAPGAHRAEPGPVPEPERPRPEPVPDGPDVDQAEPRAPDQPATVTIRHGEREITLTAPGAEGTLRLTIDDGSGRPKEYALDFGEDRTGPAAAADQPPPGPPEAAPPQRLAVQEQPVPEETVPEETDAADPEPVHPAGPDGRITITDGPLTLTVEHPDGQADATTVTVDDGTGEPTTYTLEADSGQQTTTPQAVTGMGAIAAGLPTGEAPAAADDSAFSGDGVEAGIAPPRQGQQPGGAGLGTAPGGMPAAEAGPVGGGIGAGIGEPERTRDTGRAEGDLFEVGADGNRISGTLDGGENPATDARSASRWSTD
ncbi:WXG100 family type VII secretion target [Amycolatopsis aidingensis]|uniref:WXG100 family type VII secretion target n=1 Tax=Amycolatopsis aidingensis TaxID=2842453 RepID=UPI001C0CDF95|nr:WXG100 family type VII secretion target [Amycolatopsis aidingensis]